MNAAPRCNGFRLRGLNADCDRLAVQSSEQTTWLLGRKRGGLGRIQWQEVGLAQHELIVLRPYGGAPELEIQALGDRAGLLIIDQTQTRTLSLRVGSRAVLSLKPDEAVVIRCEWLQYPRSSGVAPGAYGAGIAV